MLGLDSTMDDRVYYGKKAVKQPKYSERLLGKYGDGSAGNTLVITADALDNEKRSISAVRKVFSALQALKIPLRGQIIGLIGNTGSRRDDLLNELQDPLSVDNAPLHQDEYLGYNRAEEFVELIEEFEKVSAKDVYYLDLKTASNIPYPYICHSRNTHCKAFAAHFPFYQVMGLDAFINDHLGFYLHAKNYTCSTLKVGTHADYSVEQIHEATIWWALVRLGCLQEADVPEFPVHRQILNSCRSEEGKRTFEVIYKYTIQEDEFFRMIPGFQNFQKITIGEPLATSDGASVVSQWEGRIFMPLYHTRSNDGFFVLKEID